MTNEQRAERVLKQYGFEFDKIPKEEIMGLLRKEIDDYQLGSSEYIRLLCGYIYCIGGVSDVPLIEKAKYSINMDVGCMIDVEWIESLKNGGVEGSFVRTRQEIIEAFVFYYKDFKAEDEW